MDCSTADRAIFRWRACAFLAICTVVFVRNFDAFLYPILFGEDGTRLFLYYMEHREASSLLREYAGYVSFGANGMGWLIGLFGITSQPYLLAANAGCISVACLWLFTSPRFAHVLPDVRLRCAACVCLALAPVGNFALLTCTMFVNWHLLFAACLLAMARAPRTHGGRVAESLFVWLCLWTNPVSIVLAPIYAWRVVRDDALPNRVHYTTLGVLTLLYPLLFVTGAERAPTPVLPFLSCAGELLASRVLTEPFFGSTARFHLEGSALPYAALWPGTLVTLFIATKWRGLDRAARGWLAGAGFLIVGITAAVTYARFDRFDGMMHWGHRYSYVPKLLVYLGVVTIGFAVCSRPVLLFVVLALHALFLNVVERCYYATSYVQGEQLMQFVRDAAAWREDPEAVGEERTFLDTSRQLTIRRPRLAQPASPPASSR